jgi:hypothetical protein
VWDGREDSDGVVILLWVFFSILFLPSRSSLSYFTLSVGICCRAGVRKDPSVDLLHSVRIKNLLRFDYQLYRVRQKKCIQNLTDGICVLFSKLN